MINHISCTARARLNVYTPFQLSQLLLDEPLYDNLPTKNIHHDKVMLKTALFKTK